MGPYNHQGKLVQFLSGMILQGINGWSLVQLGKCFAYFINIYVYIVSLGLSGLKLLEISYIHVFLGNLETSEEMPNLSHHMLGAWGLVVTPHQFFKSMVTMKRISLRFTSFSKTSSLKNARYSGKVENLRISHTNSIILPLPHISTPLDSFLGLGPMFPGFPGPSASHTSKVPGRSIPCARDNHQHSSGSRAGYSRPDMVLRRATPCKGASLGNPRKTTWAAGKILMF